MAPTDLHYEEHRLEKCSLFPLVPGLVSLLPWLSHDTWSLSIPGLWILLATLLPMPHSYHCISANLGGSIGCLAMFPSDTSASFNINWCMDTAAMLCLLLPFWTHPYHPLLSTTLNYAWTISFILLIILRQAFVSYCWSIKTTIKFDRFSASMLCQSTFVITARPCSL